MAKTFASEEDQAVHSLYTRLGKMKLIMDKDGKPLKWTTVYPSLKQLIAICKKRPITLPKNPKIADVLLAMFRSGYSIIEYPTSPADKIEDWDENVFNKEIRQLGFYKIPKGANPWSVSQKEEEVSKKKIKTSPAPPIPPVEDDNDKEWDQDVQDEEAEIEAEIKAVEESEKAEQAQREADKKATLDKSS